MALDTGGHGDPHTCSYRNLFHLLFTSHTLQTEHQYSLVLPLLPHFFPVELAPGSSQIKWLKSPISCSCCPGPVRPSLGGRVGLHGRVLIVRVAGPRAALHTTSTLPRLSPLSRPPPSVGPLTSWDTAHSRSPLVMQTKVIRRQAKISQSRIRPLLGPSPGGKCQLALSYLSNYDKQTLTHGK